MWSIAQEVSPQQIILLSLLLNFNPSTLTLLLTFEQKSGVFT